MSEESKKRVPVEKIIGTVREDDSWAEDQEKREYYYDDAHGYEVFVPENEILEDFTSKIRRILKILDIPAIIPSIVGAVVHFKLAVLTEPHANVVFQRWFDSGERSTGADAIIISINSFLAKPIPTVFLAHHPVHGFPVEWWVATLVNSALWGAALYACYRLSSWIFNRLKL